MSKVKVYNLNNVTGLGEDVNAAIVGKEKVILTDNEACHTIHDMNESKGWVFRGCSPIPLFKTTINVII